MIPPVLGTLALFKPAKVTKPAKSSQDQRWMIMWWQWDPILRKVIRRRQGFDLNSIPLKADRELRALEWTTAINYLLREGYLVGTAPDPIPKEVEVVKAPHKVTSLRGIIEAFLAHHGQTVEPKTLGHYKNALEVLWETWATREGIHQVQDLTLAHGSSWTHFLTSHVVQRTGQPFTLSSQNQVLNKLRVFGLWARKEGYLKRKQLDFFLFKPRIEKASTTHRPYTPAQLQAILWEAEPDPQLTLFLHLCYSCFLRPRRECTGLRIADVGPTTIWVRPETDKSRKGRYVTIPPALYPLLASHHLSTYPRDHYLFTKKGVPGLKKVNPAYFYRKLEAILGRLGMQGQGYTLYSLKASGNIQLWLHTKDLKVLQAQNGHSTSAMTDRYLKQLGVIDQSNPLTNFPVMGALPDK